MMEGVYNSLIACDFVHGYQVFDYIWCVSTNLVLYLCVHV